MRYPSNANVHILVLGSVLAGFLALVGYPEQPEVAQAGSGGAGPAAPTPPPAHAAQTSPGMGESPAGRPALPADKPVTPAPVVMTSPFLRDIFFAYDRSVLREDQIPSLDANVVWLKADPRVRILVEGYCDMRGTSEYNRTLAQRRADAVKEYLVAGGIPADRITTVTYGKDRPFVLGNDDAAWSLNRRARLVVMTTEPAR